MIKITKNFKILSILLAIILLFNCSNKKDDPLIIPPDYNDQPNPNNPEKIQPNSNSQDLDKLKSLLLKSEE